MFRKLFMTCLLLLTVAVGCGSPEAPPRKTEDASTLRPLIGVAVPAAGEKYEKYIQAVEDAGGRTIDCGGQ